MDNKEFESKEFQEVYKKYYWSGNGSPSCSNSIAADHNNTLDKVFDEGIALGKKLGLEKAIAVLNKERVT
jgi:hypothetical protein